MSFRIASAKAREAGLSTYSNGYCARYSNASVAFCKTVEADPICSPPYAGHTSAGGRNACIATALSGSPLP